MTTVVAHHDAVLVIDYRVLASGGLRWAVAGWVRQLRQR